MIQILKLKPVFLLSVVIALIHFVSPYDAVAQPETAPLEMTEDQKNLNATFRLQKVALNRLAEEYTVDRPLPIRQIVCIYGSAADIAQLDPISWIENWFYLDLVQREFKKPDSPILDLRDLSSKTFENFDAVLDSYRQRLLYAILSKREDQKREYVDEISRPRPFWDGVTQLRWMTGSEVESTPTAKAGTRYEFRLFRSRENDGTFRYQLKYHVKVHRPGRDTDLFASVYLDMQIESGLELIQVLDEAKRLTPKPGAQLRLDFNNPIRLRVNPDGTFTFYNLPLELIESVEGKPFETKPFKASSGKLRIRGQQSSSLDPNTFLAPKDPSFIRPSQIIELWERIADYAEETKDTDMKDSMQKLLRAR